MKKYFPRFSAILKKTGFEFGRHGLHSYHAMEAGPPYAEFPRSAQTPPGIFNAMRQGSSLA